LLFIIHINDLPPTINSSLEPILFADDINVIISRKNVDDFSPMSNTVFSHTSQWFTSNRVVLNLDKTNIIKLITNEALQYDLKIGYDGRHTEESINIKLLSLQIDNHLNWKNDS